MEKVVGRTSRLVLVTRGCLPPLHLLSLEYLMPRVLLLASARQGAI
jgi:hypothetical protein